MSKTTGKLPTTTRRNWIYEYDRIKLRKLGRADLPALLELKNESWESRHTIQFLNMEDQEKWFDSITTSTQTPTTLILVAVTEGDTGHDVNFGIFKLANIDWQSRKSEVGWDVYPEFRNRGWGKRMVIAGIKFCKEVMGLHRLNAEILTTNEASRRLALACGFVQEGLQKEAILRNGKWIDSEYWGQNLW